VVALPAEQLAGAGDDPVTRIRPWSCHVSAFTCRLTVLASIRKTMPVGLLSNGEMAHK
jgi:hypothetical protein